MKNNLESIRKRKGLKGKEIAEMIHISPTYYSDLENGRARLNDETLVKLSEVLETSIDEILGRQIKSTSYQVDGKDFKVLCDIRKTGLNDEQVIDILKNISKYTTND